MSTNDTAVEIDQAAFGELAQRHRRELQVHCYRMLGSFAESEDTADLLDTTVAAVNSALQRARPAVRELLPRRRDEWRAPELPDERDRALLDRWITAIENSDDAALRALLREDVRASHQAGAGGHTGTAPTWYAGRETLVVAWAPLLHAPEPLAVRALPTWANRQPALATYVRLPGDERHRPIGPTVLDVVGGRVAEVTSFGTDLLPAFGLPAEL